MQEVSRVHSTQLFQKKRLGKGRTQLLNPHYIVGFIDGEGSFSVTVGKHKTLKRRLEIKPAFEIELRADDREILKKIAQRFGCGHFYDLNYERYGWYPHVKYKVSSVKELKNKLIPFFDRYPPQSKKLEVYKLFRQIVLQVFHKEHLTENGFKKILVLRNKIRRFGKKHNWEPPGYGKTVRPVV